jgi:outer membrane protein assembly factor BamB
MKDNQKITVPCTRILSKIEGWFPALQKINFNKSIIISLILISINLNINAQDIAQWGGNNRDGIYSDKGLLKKWPDAGPTLLWHYDNLGDGHSSAAVTSSAVYTAGMVGDKGFIYSFDLNGQLLWKSEYGTEWTQNWNGVRSSPLVYHNKVYIYSSFGILVCLDSKTGKILWTIDTFKDYDGQNITWGVTENLLCDGDKIFCTPGGTEANVIAVNADNGKLIWKCKGNSEKSAYNSPCLITLPNRKILVTMTEKSILGIDAATGTLLWSAEQTNQWSVHANTPVFRNGYLYCMSGYGKGGVMLKLKGDGSGVNEVWRDATLENRIGSYVVLDNHIIGVSDKLKKLECLDWSTGKEIYSLNVSSPGNIIYDDGLLYCYSEAGSVALIEPQPDQFNIVSSFKVPFGANQHWAHLVINNKRLYVRHGTSLMVYDVAAK